MKWGDFYKKRRKNRGIGDLMGLNGELGAKSYPPSNLLLKDGARCGIMKA